MQWNSECFDFSSSSEDLNRRCFTCGKLHASELRRCTGCYGPRFCDEKCQKKGWLVHQRFCKGSDSLIRHLLHPEAAAQIAFLSYVLPAIYSKPRGHVAFAEIMERLRQHPVQVNTSQDTVWAAQEKWVKAGQEYLSEYPDLWYSGCNTIWPRLIFMCGVMKKGGMLEIPGSITAMGLFLQNSGEAARKQATSLFFHLLPAWDSPSKDIYIHTPWNARWKDVHELLKLPGGYVFLVEMDCSDRKRVPPPPNPRAQSYQEALKIFEGPFYTHCFILVILNRPKMSEAVILQSFSGCYSLQQWCNWKQPLVAAPAPSEFKCSCSVLPAPRYRGKLDSSQLLSLARDLETLNSKTSSSKTLQSSFERVTGVQAPLDWFLSFFDFRIARFQADSFWGGIV